MATVPSRGARSQWQELLEGREKARWEALLNVPGMRARDSLRVTEFVNRRRIAQQRDGQWMKAIQSRPMVRSHDFSLAIWLPFRPEFANSTVATNARPRTRDEMLCPALEMQCPSRPSLLAVQRTGRGCPWLFLPHVSVTSALTSPERP